MPNDPGLPDLAEQLNHLFTSVRTAQGQPRWNNETASLEIARTGLTMSSAYLSQLRNGKRLNPSARHLAALADLFGVPMEYFFDPGRRSVIDDDLQLLTALRDTGARRLALHAQGLSPASVENVLGIIDQLRRLENLPATPA
ncbi:Transcriptional regulator, contains XRE-family HTH domain [Nakamurella panacisegetis]|uniref:Transcriptional regulator, contains XRE-family HTH domain n=1 Tax=Nakamurella panacisegetis TaxID=1090615 RepID=A0A1H0NLG8_9ACTN|nr:helix-turn-helix domain-containing protein [Nakamurella panacisegetis]SDO93275.1 Transcriptional regulator, contains XRE-family HTH domain [Nakamurella panacisegetis]